MKLPTWIDKDTRVLVIPKGVMGPNGEVKDGGISWRKGPYGFEWREAFERYKMAWLDKTRPLPDEGTDFEVQGPLPSPNPPDGQVWLVKRSCETCYGGVVEVFGKAVKPSGKRPHEVCDTCNGSGVIHELVREDEEEVEGYKYVLRCWANPAIHVGAEILNPNRIAGLRFVSGNGKDRFDLMREGGEG